jgi:glucosylceramidase
MRLFQLFPLLFLASALGSATWALDPEPAVTPAISGPVQVWVTTGDATKLLERQADLAWSSTTAARADNAVVNESQRFQPIEGFGASLRMPALWTEADPAVRDEIMRRLFSRSSGIGLNLLRVPMGETGLVGPDRTYNDLPAGQTDPSLSQFSIAGDLEMKIPLAQRAKELNPEVTILGTPWSAPAWMKTSGNLGYGKLRPEYYGTYANYFVKWLQEWNARGLGVSLVSMQNEPQHEPYWYQGMRMDAADQIDFAKALGPALDQAGFSARILAWDHNCDNLAYPIAVLDDPIARNWIHGAAFHAYAGTTSDIYQFTDVHPDKAVYFTEQTGLLPNRGFGGSMMWHARNIFIVPSLNNARTNAVWMLDRRLDSLAGDRPFVRISPDGKDYELYGEYYETGHFSKFIRKGAVRIGTNNPRDPITRVFTGNILYAAYQNPDGSKVLVAANDSGGTRTITVEDSGRRIEYPIPAQSLVSFLWRDATGGSGLAATYFDNADLTGTSERRTDPTIDFTWRARRTEPIVIDPDAVPPITQDFTFPAESPADSLGPDNFSARWEGSVLPSSTAPHTFFVNAADGVRLWVNDQLILDRWTTGVLAESSATIGLTAGQPATVRLEYFSSVSTGGGRIALSWATPTLAKQIIPRERLFPPAVASVPPPPLGLAVRAPNTAVSLSWQAAPTAATYTVKRATSASGPFSALASSLTGTSYTDSTTTAGTAYFYTVSATNAQGVSADSLVREITPRGATLPAPWQQQDIGNTGVTGIGGAAGSDGVISLAGAGADIWNTADAFRFAHVPVTGDAILTVRVISQERTHEWAKSGLMFRESLNANSRHIHALLTPQNGVAFHHRAATSGVTAGTNTSGPFAPHWLRLVRSGNTFTGFSSLDGVTWTQIAASVTLDLPATLFAGLSVGSTVQGTLGVTRFDSVSIPGLPAPLPPAPAGLALTPGNASVGLVWQPTPYATSYRIFRSTSLSGPFVQIGVSTSPAYSDQNAANGTTYHYQIRGVSSAGQGSASATGSATPSSNFLPFGWINADIGSVGFPGSASWNAGTYTVQASGSTIWGTSDGFNYSYTPVNGDGTMTIRADSLVNTDTFAAKSGLMFRASSAANSAYAIIALTPGGGVKFEYRSATGGNAASQGAVSGTAPRWLRLTKIGNSLTAFTSADGISWAAVGTALTLDLGSEFLAGIAVTANNNTTSTTAVLSNFSSTGFRSPLSPATFTASPGLGGITLSWSAVSGATGYRLRRSLDGGASFAVLATLSSTSFLDTGAPNRTAALYTVTALNPDGESPPAGPVSVRASYFPLPSGWTHSDIGTTGLAGYADHSTGTFTPAGAGSSLAGTSDSISFTRVSLSGAGEISARVATVGTASSTAKVGVMLRESTAANSRFAYVGLSPNGAVEFCVRTSNGGTVAVVATATGQSLPRYVRLTRGGSRNRTFIAFHSADGVTWTQIGSPQTFSSNTAFLAGLAVCSMNNTVLHPASFDNVKVTGYTSVATPSGLSSTSTPTSIHLTWTASGTGSFYRIRRSTSSSGPFIYIGETTNTEFTDATVVNGTAYYYTVTAAGSFNESAPTSVLSSAPTLVAPVAPANLTAEAGNATVSLSWAAVANAASYRVKRATTSGGPYATLASGLAGTSYTDVSAANDTTYFYVFTAENAAGEGLPSSEISATPVAPGTTPPSGLTARADNKSVVLSWNALFGSVSYSVKRATASGGPYTTLATGITATTFTDTTAVFGSPYFYVVSGVNALSAASPDSAPATATATTSTWSGPDLASWSDASAWTGAAPFSGGSFTFLFNAATARSGSQDLADLTASAITFESTAAAHTFFGSSPVTLTGNLSVASAAAQTLAFPLTLNGPRTVDVATGGSLILSGGLLNGSSAAGLIKTGAGSLILSGSAALAAPSRLVLNSASTVTLRHPAALGASDGGISIANGINTALAFETDSPVNRYNFGGGSTPATTTLSVGRLTSGPGFTQPFGIFEIGSRSLTVNTGPNIASGTMGASFTELRLTAGNNDRPVLLNGSAAYTVGSVARFSNFGANTTRRLQLDGTSAFNTVGPISNGSADATTTLSLIKANTSTWSLTGNTTHTGPTSIEGGTLRLGNGGTTGTLSLASALTFLNGATLGFNRSDTVTQGVHFPTLLSGPGRLAQSGPGTVVLNSSNLLAPTTGDVLTFTAGGTVALAHPAALGASGSWVRFSASGGGVLALRTDTSANSLNLTSGSTHGGTLLLDRATSGPGFTHTLGLLDLGSVNFTFNPGPNLTDSAATASFTEVRLTGGNDNQPVTLVANTGVQIASASITANALPKRLRLDGAATNSTLGTITNGLSTVSLLKAGPGRWTLTGPASHTGLTTVSAGELCILGDATHATGAVSVGDGNADNGSATLSGTGTLGGAVTTVSDGVIAPGSGGLGTLAFASSATLGGSLRLEIDGSSSDRLAVTGALATSAATLELQSLSGGVTAASYTLATFGSLSGAASFASVTGLPAGYAVLFDLSGQRILLARLTPSFGDWAGSAGLTGDSALPTADPDADGLANLLEFTFGSSPSGSQPSGLVPQVSSSVPASLVFSFPRTHNARDAGVVLVVEAGATLGSWPITLSVGVDTASSAAGVVVTPRDSASDLVTVTLPMEAGSARLFARLRASLPAP